MLLGVIKDLCSLSWGGGGGGAQNRIDPSFVLLPSLTMGGTISWEVERQWGGMISCEFSASSSNSIINQMRMCFKLKKPPSEFFNDANKKPFSDVCVQQVEPRTNNMWGCVQCQLFPVLICFQRGDKTLCYHRATYGGEVRPMCFNLQMQRLLNSHVPINKTSSVAGKVKSVQITLFGICMFRHRKWFTTF